MNIREMQLFLSLAEEKNITRAAQKNSYTQSNVSHTLKNMEQELGFPLFYRSPKGLHITENGKSLLPLVRQVLSANELFEQQAAAIRGIQKGHIVIGAYISTSIQWLPKALAHFHKRYPEIKVEIREGGFQDIADWLENGSVDFGISCKSSQEKMRWIPLKKEPYLAVCSPDSVYAEKKEFDLHLLESVSTIMAMQNAEPDLYRQFDELGIKPKITYESLNDHAVLALAEHNLGVCILPELILRSCKTSGITLPVTPPIERVMGIRLPTDRELSPAAKLFLYCLIETVKEIEGE